MRATCTGSWQVLRIKASSWHWWLWARKGAVLEWRCTGDLESKCYLPFCSRWIHAYSSQLQPPCRDMPSGEYPGKAARTSSLSLSQPRILLTRLPTCFLCFVLFCFVDAAVVGRASPKAASTPKDSFDLEQVRGGLMCEERW